MRIPQDVGEIYQKLQNHGVETYALEKIRGTVQLILQHISQTHRENDTQYNFNTLGLERHTIPQYAKKTEI